MLTPIIERWELKPMMLVVRTWDAISLLSSNFLPYKTLIQRITATARTRVHSEVIPEKTTIANFCFVLEEICVFFLQKKNSYYFWIFFQILQAYIVSKNQTVNFSNSQFDSWRFMLYFSLEENNGFIPL